MLEINMMICYYLELFLKTTQKNYENTIFLHFWAFLCIFAQFLGVGNFPHPGGEISPPRVGIFPHPGWGIFPTRGGDFPHPGWGFFPTRGGDFPHPGRGFFPTRGGDISPYAWWGNFPKGGVFSPL